MLAISILWWEMQNAAVRKRFWLSAAAYATAWSLFLLLVWPKGGGTLLSELQQLSDTFFLWFLRVQAAIAVLGCPALVAGSLLVEKQQGSLELLLLSPISRAQIVFTKSVAQIIKIGGLLTAVWPILILGLCFGGFSLSQFSWGVCLMFGLVVLSGSAGALAGSLFQTFFMALLGSYCFLAVFLAIVPLMLSCLWHPFWYILSPLGMMPAVFDLAPELPGGHFGPVIVIAGWMGVSLLLLHGAAFFLVPARETGQRTCWPRGNAPEVEARQLKMRHSSQLLLWRELQNKLPHRTLRPLVLGCGAVLAMASCNVLFHEELVNASAGLAASLGLVASAIVVALLVGTASMVRERRQGELELLLLTRLSSMKVLKSKYCGVKWTVFPLVLAVLVQCALGAEPLLAAMICMPLLFAFVNPAIQAGILGGLKSDNLLSAFRSAFFQFGIMLALNTINLAGIALFVGFVGAVPLLLLYRRSAEAACLAYSVAVSFFLARYNREELRPKIFQSICSQLDRGGMDTEWYGWAVPLSWSRILPSIVLWGSLALVILMANSRATGIFASLLIGTVLSVCVPLVIIAAIHLAVRSYLEGGARRAPG